ncbi:MAG: hypothetical protein ACRDOD_21395 [Streptosporangiaceae bacterium]
MTIALDPSARAEVRAGDTVSVTLPRGTITPGVVTSAGTVVTTSAAPACRLIRIHIRPGAAGVGHAVTHGYLGRR